MQTIHLIGAKSVEKAGYAIRGAAEDMNRAVANMQYAFEQHQRFLDEWLGRLETLIAEALKEGVLK